MTTVTIARPNIIIRTNVASVVGPIGPSGPIGPTGGGFLLANVTSTPYTPAAGATHLLCNYAGALAINLPLAATRSLPLTIKDISGAASVNNITVNRAGLETIDGATSYVILADYGAITLIPVTGGWIVI